MATTKCSNGTVFIQKNIQERKCRGNTPITVKYKDQKRSPNLYEEQDIGDPLDFYGDDYEEIPEPTKRNEPTQNPELLIPEIITVQTGNKITNWNLPYVKVHPALSLLHDDVPISDG